MRGRRRGRAARRRRVRRQRPTGRRTAVPDSVPWRVRGERLDVVVTLSRCETTFQVKLIFSIERIIFFLFNSAKANGGGSAPSYATRSTIGRVLSSMRLF